MHAEQIRHVADAQRLLPTGDMHADTIARASVAVCRPSYRRYAAETARLVPGVW